MRHATWLCLRLLIGVTTIGGQEPRGPFRVTIKDGKAVIGERTLQLDPTPRIKVRRGYRNTFGLTLEGKRITSSWYGSTWHDLMVDANVSGPFTDSIVEPRPLPLTASGKIRLGAESTWRHANIHVTQISEIVRSKLSTKAAVAAQERALDTCRFTYILENQDKVAHKVAFRAWAYIHINNNDRALYSSPRTEPGKILNGVRLEGKTLPEYLWVLERPDLADPGFVATMTLRRLAENSIPVGRLS